MTAAWPRLLPGALCSFVRFLLGVALHPSASCRKRALTFHF
jgi:hypothetical protein